MNEHEEREAVRGAMNRCLSGLKGNPFLAQRIVENEKGKRPAVKKRLSAGLVLALAAVLVTVAALAVGLAFSPRYDAKRLANRALEVQYGITDDMMTVFRCSDAGTGADGSRVFTYEAVEALYAKQIGVYTVTVKGGKALAAWSHDGEDTSGGAEAEAWGAGQLAMLCSDRYGEMLAALPAASDTSAAPTATPPGNAEEDDQAQLAAWEESRAQVEAASRLSLAEARDLAVAAVGGEYGLTAAQCDRFVLYEDSDGVTYRFLDGQPVADLFLRLTQKDDGTRTEKDGIYMVTVNMDSGVIEDILYDSGLAANE